MLFHERLRQHETARWLPSRFEAALFPIVCPSSTSIMLFARSRRGRSFAIVNFDRQRLTLIELAVKKVSLVYCIYCIAL